jgi:transposase-like protein
MPSKRKVGVPVHESNPALAIALQKSEVIRELPRACCDEQAAVEFFERHRWADCPACPRCGDVDVYPMMKRTSKERQENFRWRCRGCQMQYTVRTGTIFEDSAVPMHKWAHAVWLTSAGKKGVAALELARMIQVSYPTALFMMHRLRWAMAEVEGAEPLRGVVEVDEKYVGGKPRPISKAEREKLIADGKEVPVNKRGRGTKKVPVLTAVQRDGKVRSRVVANVNAGNLREFIRKNVHRSAALCTDEAREYKSAAAGFEGGHHTTTHSHKEYAHTDAATGLRVHSNTAESSFALLQRSMVGTYHNVSDRHLHRYVAHSDWLWNSRKVSDGDRVRALVRACEGKRLIGRDPSRD